MTESGKVQIDLLTAREAAKYLRVSLSTLERLERQGFLSPYLMPGGHRRYTIEMLNDLLSQNEHDPSKITAQEK